MWRLAHRLASLFLVAFLLIVTAQLLTERCRPDRSTEAQYGVAPA